MSTQSVRSQETVSRVLDLFDDVEFDPGKPLFFGDFSCGLVLSPEWEADRCRYTGTVVTRPPAPQELEGLAWFVTNAGGTELQEGRLDHLAGFEFELSREVCRNPAPLRFRLAQAPVVTRPEPPPPGVVRRPDRIPTFVSVRSAGFDDFSSGQRESINGLRIGPDFLRLDYTIPKDDPNPFPFGVAVMSWHRPDGTVVRRLILVRDVALPTSPREKSYVGSLPTRELIGEAPLSACSDQIELELIQTAEELASLSRDEVDWVKRELERNREIRSFPEHQRQLEELLRNWRRK